MSVALYIRLSLADEDTGFSKAESESIVSQRMCLHSYLDNNKLLSKMSRTEFVDDGFTATNGNRPNFIKMMDKVQAGEIKLIIVRDFSRFFRDYIEAGNYLECVFPFLGVRFISINDNYDSDDYKGSTGGLEMVMRNIIYASYSKDLSVKTTTAKVHLMKQGKFVGGYAPYGYEMDKTEKHKLAIDVESSKVVRRIFDEAIKGHKTAYIAKMLNEENIPTMSQYFKLKYPNSKKFSNTSDKVTWSYQMIHHILKNKVYTGCMVSHRRKQVSIGSKKSIMQEPIIVEDTHTAIVTMEEFEKAIATIGIGSHGKLIRVQHQYPLKSLVKCGNCKRNMAKVKRKNTSDVFLCKYSSSSTTSECTKEKFKEAELEKIVFQAISDYVNSLAERNGLNNSSPNKTNDIITELGKMDLQIEGLKTYKIRLYENYTSGDVTKELFLKQKAEADKKIAEFQNFKCELEENLQAGHEEKTVNSQSDNLISLFAKETKLTCEMAQAFIKAIYVYSKEEIEIEWKFKDIF